MRTAIPVVFFALAAWFVFGPAQTALPIAPAAGVTAADIDPSPPRVVREDLTVLDVGGTPLRCSDCHRLFESKRDTSKTLMQHTEIVLDHGLNDRCFNCHAFDDRDKLELHDGTLVDFTAVEQLCAKCHGPTFRDWERGMHGRTDGHWDASAGPQQRLACNQCHDPHAPAHSGLTPLPGPNTLRMGEQDAETHHGDGPLVPWRRSTEEHDG